MKDEARLAIAETKWGQKELSGRLTSLKYLVIGQIVIVIVMSGIVIGVILGGG